MENQANKMMLLFLECYSIHRYLIMQSGNHWQAGKDPLLMKEAIIGGMCWCVLEHLEKLNSPIPIVTWWNAYLVTCGKNTWTKPASKMLRRLIHYTIHLPDAYAYSSKFVVNVSSRPWSMLVQLPPQRAMYWICRVL